MKFAYFLAIAVGAQDGGDGGTPHDPEAMAFCQGKFKGIQNYKSEFEPSNNFKENKMVSIKM